jgi:glycosyltransferase involved in cell wall biosynthesis
VKAVVNALPLLSPTTGIARYTYQISRFLKEDWGETIRFYYGYYSSRLIAPEEGAALRTVKGGVVRHPAVKRAIREMLAFSARIYAPAHDLYWEPNFIPQPQIRARRIVATVHDFSFRLHPRWHPRERREYFRRHFETSLRRAERVITGSEYTRGEILDALPFVDGKVRVIPHGVDHSLYREHSREETEPFVRRLKLPESFLLYVGSIEPRKNLLGLLQAYHRLPRPLKEAHPLILAGFGGWENREIMEWIDKERRSVRYLGYLSDRDLARLYSLATLFLYPSLYEGFGLPPLEAMACGTAVAVSDTASLPEVCGDAALYFDPKEPDSIAEAIRKGLEDRELRTRLEREGRIRSRSFGWERSAELHRKVFEEVLGA